MYSHTPETDWPTGITSLLITDFPLLSGSNASSTLSLRFQLTFTSYCRRHDPTRLVAQGTLGFTAFQRQWIGLSAAGDSVNVEPIDWSQMGNDVYLESIDIEVRVCNMQATNIRLT